MNCYCSDPWSSSLLQKAFLPQALNLLTCKKESKYNLILHQNYCCFVLKLMMISSLILFHLFQQMYMAFSFFMYRTAMYIRCHDLGMSFSIDGWSFWGTSQCKSSSSSSSSYSYLEFWVRFCLEPHREYIAAASNSCWQPLCSNWTPRSFFINGFVAAAAFESVANDIFVLVGRRLWSPRVRPQLTITREEYSSTPWNQDLIKERMLKGTLLDAAEKISSFKESVDQHQFLLFLFFILGSPHENSHKRINLAKASALWT
jgi:hypothetical protein